jgi:Meiotically up-regulated gene 113
VTKAHILAEIKRTASENSGVPLGVARFEAETGIKEADWLGVHWARWGDAVREAGLEPNRMQAAFDKEHLLRKLAELAIELGRIPVRGDLKLKRRKDPSYPSWNTFDRLGNKVDLIRQLGEFCRFFPEFTEVSALCGAFLETSDDSAEENSAPTDGIAGYVYLFKSGRFHKIGKSNSAGRREHELGIQLPERIEAVHVIRTDDPAGIEEYWHKRFGAKRKNGEWFDLDAADIRAFKRRKFM